MFAFFLVILGIASRLWQHTPQFTAILAVAMFGGMYLPRRQAILVPVCLMMATDLLLGFHDTMFYTWGSMLLVSAIGIWLKDHKTLPAVIAGSLAASLLFFIVTNFGAWLSPLYPHTLDGLRDCYLAAIPFFRSTVVSTLAYSVVLYAGYEWMLKRCQGSALAKLL